MINKQRVLAQIYDAHHQLHLEDLSFWLELAQQAAGPILELGCGTGRILLPFLEVGLDVTGLDRDENMLAVLREKSKSIGQSPCILQADMAAFHLQQRFALIILPCNTLSTLEDATRLNMFDRVSEHLTPGGIFATSLPNPNLLASLPTHAELEYEESFPHPTDGSTVQVSNAWDHDTETFRLYWQYDIAAPSGKPEQLIATSTHQLIPAIQYFSEIEHAGLRIVNTYGDFNHRPFTRRSRNLVVLGQK